MTEIRIAVVEDHHDQRRELVNLLTRQAGWSVVAECVDAEQAVRILPDQKPDIVLLDLGLPGTSGLDIIPIIKRKLGPRTAIVVLTVSKSGADIFNAIQAGACSYVFKGTTADELVQAVRDVIAGEAPFLSAAVSRKLVQWIRNGHRSDRHGLSDREWGILKLAGNGKQNAQIASTLGIALNTVKNHFRNIYEKLDVHTRTEALIKIKGGRGLIDDGR